jgi:predicted DNA-binding WGR domain protein
MNTIRLECKNGSANKFYEFQGTQINGRFTVKASYGRIGQAGLISIIYDGVSKAEAEKEFEKKKSQKLKKGYVIVTDGKPVQAAAEKKTMMFK